MRLSLDIQVATASLAMAEAKDDDPFSWDVDRVVKELCTTDRTWRPTANARFPDPDLLAARLREAEYDGEVLLSSLDHESDLWSTLGVAAPKHKMALRTAIGQFQARSRQYQDYKSSLRYPLDDLVPTQAGNEAVPFVNSHLSSILPASAGDDVSQGIRSQRVERNVSIATAEQESGGSSEPPKKKQRRLEATQLMTVDSRSDQSTLFSRAPILTEADTIMSSRIEVQPLRRETISEGIQRQQGPASSTHETLASAPGAFWGNGKLSYSDLLAFDAELDDDRSFGFGQPLPFGRGRKKWVNGRIKRFLRNSHSIISNDDESVLPVLGESDDDDNPEWQDVYREIEDEEQEVRREKEEALARTSQLTPAEVENCLKAMVDEHVALWQETKLPRLQRKALRTWRQSRRTGPIREIKRLSESVEMTRGRLEKLLENLKDNVYSNEKELRRMRPILEPTIEEVERLKWCIGIVQSAESPTAPLAATKNTSTARTRPVTSPVDGIDIWSEDDSDDFVVDDVEEDEGRFIQVEHPLGASLSPKLPMDDKRLTTSDGAVSDPAQSFGSCSDVTMYDLTEPGSSSKTPIKLDTPLKPKPRRSLRPAAGESDPSDELPLHAVQDIAQKGVDYWKEKDDHQRLVITIIAKISSEQRRKRVFDAVILSDVEEAWNEHIEKAIKLQPVPLESLSQDVREKTRRDTATLVARLFDAYVGPGVTTPAQPSERFQSLTAAAAKRIGRHQHCFADFYHFIRSLAPHFGISEIVDNDGACLDGPMSGDDKDDASDLTSAQRSAQKKKRQKIAQNKSASLRKEENKEAQDKEVRRLLFRQNAQNSSLLPREKTRLIINESKLEGQGLIFVHDNIAPRIKDHQIDGVRFMWDEITKDTKHGCLLAHTMGLGKTMQIITLLVAIAEATSSDDATVTCQVPEHLKALRTLILAPSGILNNWLEELQRWAPSGVLGYMYYVEASSALHTRDNTIKAWSKTGGILLMGYPLFRALPGKNEDLLRILLKETSLVIADEAHHLKNQKASLSKLANSFKTQSRIALTGSPLSNNVEEYYSMINWISPGFLGEPEEFTVKYGQPIKEGLWKDASTAVRRRAKICLATLKRVVRNKVHRRTVASLKGHGLPPKKEFLIYLDLSEVQKNIYQVFVQNILASSRNMLTGKLHVKSVWSLVSTLRLLLAHPTILHAHLQATQAEASRTTTRESSNSDDEPLDAADSAVWGEPAQVLSSTLDTLMVEQVHSAIDASYKMMALDKILEETLRLGDNILVFSQSILSLDFVESKLCREKHRPYKRLDGSTPTVTRQKMVNEFNAGTQQVFLISTTAGGVGLNIYGANRVVILDSKYNPLHEQQAIGRAYRMGQTKKVFVYWLLCDGTFERVMQNQQIFKNQLFSQVVDEKNPLPKADPNLKVWFKTYEEAPRQDLSQVRGQDPVLDALLCADKLSGNIASIETTDTFEEEDLDADLGADEQLEAERMAAEQAVKAGPPGQQQTNQVRRTRISPTLPPIPNPSVETSSTEHPRGAHEGHAAEDPRPEATHEIHGPNGFARVTPVDVSSYSQAQNLSPAGLESGPLSDKLPTARPANTPDQNLSQWPARAYPLPAFAKHTPTILGGSGAQPMAVSSASMRANTTNVAPMVAINYAPQPFELALAGTRQDSPQQLPDPSHPPGNDHFVAVPNSRTDSTYRRQQQQLPALRFESGQAATGQASSHVIASERATPSRLAQALPQHWQSEPARPMTIGNTHRRPDQPPRSSEADARYKLRMELVRNVSPSEGRRVEHALQEMARHLEGDIPRRLAWVKLADLVRSHPACATALINGRVEPELLARAFTMGIADLATSVLGRTHRAQDPNV